MPLARQQNRTCRRRCGALTINNECNILWTRLRVIHIPVSHCWWCITKPKVEVTIWSFRRRQKHQQTSASNYKYYFISVICITAVWFHEKPHTFKLITGTISWSRKICGYRAVRNRKWWRLAHLFRSEQNMFSLPSGKVIDPQKRFWEVSATNIWQLLLDVYRVHLSVARLSMLEDSPLTRLAWYSKGANPHRPYFMTRVL